MANAHVHVNLGHMPSRRDIVVRVTFVVCSL